MTLEVALVANTLAVGGTEKSVVTHARSLDPAAVRVRVVAAREDGPLRGELAAAGIEVAVAAGDADVLAAQLAGVDVVHVFRSGGREPLVPAAARRAGVRALVETNVFGQVDGSADEARFACHLFVSRFCAERYRRRTRQPGPAFHERHRVSYWPIDVARVDAETTSREEARRALRLDPDRPVVVRVGRADERKWRDLLAEMVPELLARVPDAQVLFVGAPARGLRSLHRLGVLDRVALLPELTSTAGVVAAYTAADAVVTAAAIGESCSVAIAEAMTSGRAVVTCSTPWTDNAQIEQVDEGVTGHVADHPRPFAEAVARLLEDDGHRRALEQAARAKAVALHDAASGARQLERLYAAVAAGEPPPGDWSPAPAEVDAFAAEYAHRLERSYGPLTAAERREAAAAQLAERGRWAGGAIRRLDSGTAALALSSLRGRVARR